MLMQCIRAEIKKESEIEKIVDGWQYDPCVKEIPLIQKKDWVMEGGGE